MTRLAIKYQLTAYDAAYLNLALQQALPLATLDNLLAAVAKAEGVTLLGPPPWLCLRRVGPIRTREQSLTPILRR